MVEGIGNRRRCCVEKDARAMGCAGLHKNILCDDKGIRSADLHLGLGAVLLGGVVSE